MLQKYKVELINGPYDGKTVFIRDERMNIEVPFPTPRNFTIEKEVAVEPIRVLIYRRISLFRAKYKGEKYV